MVKRRIHFYRQVIVYVEQIPDSVQRVLDHYSETFVIQRHIPPVPGMFPSESWTGLVINDSITTGEDHHRTAWVTYLRLSRLDCFYRWFIPSNRIWTNIWLKLEPYILQTKHAYVPCDFFRPSIHVMKLTTTLNVYFYCIRRHLNDFDLFLIADLDETLLFHTDEIDTLADFTSWVNAMEKHNMRSLDSYVFKTYFFPQRRNERYCSLIVASRRGRKSRLLLFLVRSGVQATWWTTQNTF